MPPEVINLVSDSDEDDDSDPLPPAPVDDDNGNKRKRGDGAEDKDEDEEAAARRRIMQHAAQRVASAAAGPAANPLMAQLHRERLARQAAAAAAAGAGSAPASSSSPRAAPRPAAAPPSTRPPPFSLLTFNIWFEESRQPFVKRIPLIADVIARECGCPDVVLLQEVTRETHAMLLTHSGSSGGSNASSWAARYDWSPAPRGRLGYYTLLLVRRDSPLRRSAANPAAGPPPFRFRPFANSQMERGLQTCAVSSGGGFVPPLVVATTHLESPTPPVWRSEERVAQISDAIALLDGRRPSQGALLGGAEERPPNSSSCPNVLIAGDLNWGEREGEMPLPGGWQDAWVAAERRERGGGEDGSPIEEADPEGYTYDAKLNVMLRSRLRLRLDRCLGRLRDWRVSRASLVGTRGTPPAVKGEVGLGPSDHFGLLIRFEGVEGAAGSGGGGGGGARGHRLGGGGGEEGNGGGGSGSGGGGSGGNGAPVVVV